MQKKDDLKRILPDMPPLVREFAKYKAIIENCSHLTVTEYVLDLRTFFRYLTALKYSLPTDGEEFEKIDISRIDLEFIKLITKDDIYDFLMFAAETRNNSAAAKARKLSSVKAFYKYLTSKTSYLDINPAADIGTPKKPSSLPKFLSLDESVLLLSTIEKDINSKTRLRDYAIITLFLNCGLRLSELVGININDIDSEMRSVRIFGKGAKERIVYLNDACRRALTDYLVTRLDECISKGTVAPVFISGRGTRISREMVQKIVLKYLSLAGLGNKGLSTHKLRHTAATLMYQSGNVDVRVLKDILGHSQLNTTQIYTHVSNAGMEHAMYANPLSDIKKKKEDENTGTEDAEK